MSVQMDETFATALRELLVEHAQSTREQRSWFARWRRQIAGSGAALILVAGAGIAYASGVFRSGPPGGEVVVHLAKSVTVTGVGTQTVQLGRQPLGTTDIDIRFACLTAGSFQFGGGAGFGCGAGDVAQLEAHPAIYAMPVMAGEDSMTITAAAGARWRLTATYSNVSTTPWGINASGQTYGVINHHGTPDLVSAVASNGRAGYVYANQLNAPAPKTPAQAIAEDHAPEKTLIVYESNGHTPIGEFHTLPNSWPPPTHTTTTLTP
jgi:hypothetical protein